jgi:hypothetical protein
VPKRREITTNPLADVHARNARFIFVQALRHWLEQQPSGAAGWLGALRAASERHRGRRAAAFTPS